MRTSSAFFLLVLATVSACTGSPATLAMRPDFEVATSAGPTSVSIREVPRGMTIAEFKQTVKIGMEAVMSTSLQSPPAAAPFPERRIVWHVNPMPSRGESRLMVNIFNGSVPFASAQQVIDNDAPPEVVESVVRSITRRFLVVIDPNNRTA